MHKFEIPVFLSVNGVLKRGSVNRSYDCYTMLKISVPDLLSEDVPVAVVLSPTKGSSYYTGEDEIEIRVCNGRFYSRVVAPDRDNNMEPVTVSMLRQFMKSEEGITYRNQVEAVLPAHPEWIENVLFENCQYREKPRLFTEDGWKDYQKTSVEQQLQKAKELYDELIVIDGVFWKEVPEPVYVLHHSTYFTSDDSYTYATVEYKSYTKSSSEYKYNLNSWGDVVNDAYEKYKANINDISNVQIVLPDMFTYDDFEIKIIDLLKQAVRTGGDQLQDKPVEHLLVWAILRDKLGTYVAYPGVDFSLEDVMNAAEDFHESPCTSGWAKDHTSKAIGIWENRSFNVDQLRSKSSLGM